MTNAYRKKQLGMCSFHKKLCILQKAIFNLVLRKSRRGNDSIYPDQCCGIVKKTPRIIFYCTKKSENTFPLCAIKYFSVTGTFDVP